MNRILLNLSEFEVGKTYDRDDVYAASDDFDGSKWKHGVAYSGNTTIYFKSITKSKIEITRVDIVKATKKINKALIKDILKLTEYNKDELDHFWENCTCYNESYVHDESTIDKCTCKNNKDHIMRTIKRIEEGLK